MNNEDKNTNMNGENTANVPENNNQEQQQEPKRKFKLGVPKPIKNWLNKSDDRTNGEKLKAIGVKVATVGAIVGAFALGKRVADMARDEQDRLLCEADPELPDTSQDDEVVVDEPVYEDEVVDVEEYVTEEV